jgi:hypothetical protein
VERHDGENWGLNGLFFAGTLEDFMGDVKGSCCSGFESDVNYQIILIDNGEE